MKLCTILLGLGVAHTALASEKFKVGDTVQLIAGDGTVGVVRSLEEPDGVQVATVSWDKHHEHLTKYNAMKLMHVDTGKVGDVILLDGPAVYEIQKKDEFGRVEQVGSLAVADEMLKRPRSGCPDYPTKFCRSIPQVGNLHVGDAVLTKYDKIAVIKQLFPKYALIGPHLAVAPIGDLTKPSPMEKFKAGDYVMLENHVHQVLHTFGSKYKVALHSHPGAVATHRLDRAVKRVSSFDFNVGDIVAARDLDSERDVQGKILAIFDKSHLFKKEALILIEWKEEGKEVEGKKEKPKVHRQIYWASDLVENEVKAWFLQKAKVKRVKIEADVKL